MRTGQASIGTAAAAALSVTLGVGAAHGYLQPGDTLPPVPTAASELGTNSVQHVHSAGEFAVKWNPTQPLYVEGEQKVSAGELAELSNWLTEHNLRDGKNWTVLLVEHAANYEYARGTGHEKHGVDGYLAELHDRFVTGPRFNALVDHNTGEKNGALLFVSLDNDGQNRKMILWTKDQYSEYDAGSESSLFNDKVFPEAASIIRDQGQFAAGVKHVVTSLDTALTSDMSHPFHISKEMMTDALWIGGTILVIAGLVAISEVEPKRSRYSRRSGYSSDSSSSFIFFDSGGFSSCGSSDCGGGCDGGDGGGGGSF